MEYLPTLRALVRAHEAFTSFTSPHVRSLGLTPTQFKVIANLGKESPLTYKLLSERTHISKASLTGVVNRLTADGYLKLVANKEDGRSQLISLTPKGQKTFKRVLPAQAEFMEKAFDKLSKEDAKQIQASLALLMTVFENSKSAK